MLLQAKNFTSYWLISDGQGLRWVTAQVVLIRSGVALPKNEWKNPTSKKLSVQIVQSLDFTKTAWMNMLFSKLIKPQRFGKAVLFIFPWSTHDCWPKQIDTKS